MDEKQYFSAKSLGAIIDNIIVEKGWQDKILQEKLHKMWEETVGSKIASISFIQKFENGILFIKTDSSVWKAEITLRRENIIQKMNELIGKNAIKKLIIL